MSLATRRAGGPCAPTWASSGTAVLADSASSIPPEATGRLDGEQFVEIEINDCLQCLTGGAVAQRFGHCLEPSDIFHLQGEQFGDRCVPTLGPSTPPQRVSWARCSSTPSLALAIACLALGAGERTLIERRRAFHPSATRINPLTVASSRKSIESANSDADPIASATANSTPK